GALTPDLVVESDTRSLWPAVDALLEAAGPSVHALRSAARSGVATALNDLTASTGVAVLVHEQLVPVRPAGARACTPLAIAPCSAASAGSFVAVTPPPGVDAALAALRWVPGCEEAAEIGEIRPEPAGMVVVESSVWCRRVVDRLLGDPLPRV